MSLKPQKTYPDRMVFHIDMDAFFAAVEQFENPNLVGKPVIIGGVDSPRGVVSTASYEARIFGIHSAMPVREARRRCPHGVFINGRHEVYGAYSRRIMDILGEFSPIIEQVSIDEAFLDMTGTEGLFGSPEKSAQRLKQVIRNRIGLVASVGVAPNKFLAKLASDVKKPDGLFLVRPDEVQSFLDPLPVERIWGVGKKTVPDMHQHGLYTIAQVRQKTLADLEALFGARFGGHLHALSRGEDNRDLETDWREKSISHESTFDEDTSDTHTLETLILDLSDRVARRARRDEMAGRTISFVWRDPDFSRHSRSRTISEPTLSSETLYSIALSLFRDLLPTGKISNRKFRLIGVRLSHFGIVNEQLSLFAPQEPKRPGLDKAMDAVRDRFGHRAISRARLMNTSDSTPLKEDTKKNPHAPEPP
jgi:DNA polymerase IV